MNEQQMDVTKKYVRVTALRPNGFVEFDFAVGEPELYVELLMNQAAFQDFCQVNDVVLLDGPRPSGGAEAEWDWRLNHATTQLFRD